MLSNQITGAQTQTYGQIYAWFKVRIRAESSVVELRTKFSKFEIESIIIGFSFDPLIGCGFFIDYR